MAGKPKPWPPAPSQGDARDFFVRPNGKGDGTSINNALGSVQACIDKVKYPGDTCLLMAGNYREEVKVDGKFGTKEKPILIKAYGDGPVTLDGTTDINGEWKQLKPGSSVYYIPHKEKVWQLFLDGEMMTNARWPNAKWSDKSIFDASRWGKSTSASTQHKMVDEGGKLAQSGLDATGSVAILNIGSWDTVVAKVTQHKSGQSWFDFENTWGSLGNFHPGRGQYFLESKLDFLDSEEEWFIDEKNIYLWAPGGKNPTGSKIQGKKMTYAFTITNSAHIVFRDMDFFATAITTIPDSRKSAHIGDLGFFNLNFRYPSYSKRILGIPKKPDWMKINAFSRRPEEFGSLEFFNCTWFGADGIPLAYSGQEVRVTNCLWELNDWSCANTDVGSGGKATIISGSSRKEWFIRNTLRNNGASAGYRPNDWSEIKLNEIEGQCWGLGQSDGAGMQIMIKAQNAHPIIANNWVHDSPKLGIRFDCPNHGENWDYLGRNATVTKNVVWNAGGIMVKGDKHKVIRNLAFKKGFCEGFPQGDIRAKVKSHLIVPHWIGSNPIPFNNETTVLYNIADVATGGRNRKTKIRGPPSGNNVKGNFPDPWYNCEDVPQGLVDSEHFDFRPKTDSRYAKAGAGPYQSGVNTVYWIPGRQLKSASRPIPVDGQLEVDSDRDALIFLQGYDATGHKVYCHDKKEWVERRLKKALVKQLEGHANMAAVAGTNCRLKSGTTYYWTVDATTAQGVVKGDIWTFTVA